MKNKRVFSQLHNGEPCNTNSNRKRICRENNIIPEHSVRQNNKLQKNSGSSSMYSNRTREILARNSVK